MIIYSLADQKILSLKISRSIVSFASLREQNLIYIFITIHKWLVPNSCSLWSPSQSVQPGPDSIGIVAISHGCTGVAARACGLVGLEPTRVSSPGFVWGNYSSRRFVERLTD